MGTYLWKFRTRRSVSVDVYRGVMKTRRVGGDRVVKSKQLAFLKKPVEVLFNRSAPPPAHGLSFIIVGKQI
jgi:hypothetical protein